MQQSSPKLVTSVRPGVYVVRSGALRKPQNPCLRLHLCSTTTTTTTKDHRGSDLGLALRGGRCLLGLALRGERCLLGEWGSSTQQLEDAECKVAGDMKRSPGPTKPILIPFPREGSRDRVTKGDGVLGLRKELSLRVFLLLLLQLPLLRESCAF